MHTLSFVAAVVSRPPRVAIARARLANTVSTASVRLTPKLDARDQRTQRQQARHAFCRLDQKNRGLMDRPTNPLLGQHL